jgi:hypothetical protein
MQHNRTFANNLINIRFMEGIQSRLSKQTFNFQSKWQIPYEKIQSIIAQYENNEINAQYAKRNIHDCLYFSDLFHFINYKIFKYTFEIQFVNILNQTNRIIVERRQISSKFEYPCSSHYVINIAIGIINIDFVRISEYFADRFIFDHIVHGWRHCMRNNDINDF